MRCLTLAEYLVQKGYKTSFLMREPSVSSIQRVIDAGHDLIHLKSTGLKKKIHGSSSLYSNYLTVSEEVDAIETGIIANNLDAVCVIVDHYALGAVWHNIVRKNCGHVVVIDDLANRYLNCTLVLNQSIDPSDRVYDATTPDGCIKLLGPKYTILGGDFQNYRKNAFRRIFNTHIASVLVCMGGVDAKNHTLQILKQLEHSENAKTCKFHVIVGAGYPFYVDLEKYILSSSNCIELKVNVPNMAQYISEADVGIGAAGTSVWERCVLGLPSLTMSIAPNQTDLLTRLDMLKAVKSTDVVNLKRHFDSLFTKSGATFRQNLSLKSLELCDGLGAHRFFKSLEKIIG